MHDIVALLTSSMGAIFVSFLVFFLCPALGSRCLAAEVASRKLFGFSYWNLHGHHPIVVAACTAWLQ